MRRFLSLLMAIGLILTTATACIPILAVDTTFDLKANESWTVEIDVTVTQEVATLLTSQMSNLQQEWQKYQEKGVQISMGEIKKTDEGNSILPIVASGQGYELLNSELFSGQQVVIPDPDNPDQYVFSFGSGGMSGLNLSGALSYSITLNAGRIVETNGEKKDSNTVVWTNFNGPMIATFTKGSDLTWLWWTLGGVGGVGLLGGGTFAIVKSRKPRQPAGFGAAYTPGFTIPPESNEYMQYQTGPAAPASPARFCTNCGSPLPTGASFCPACGKKY